VGEERCFRCDRLLFPGRRRYVVTIRIAVDPDEELPDTFYVDGGLKGIFRSSDADEVDLPGEESNAEMSFTLCPPCRHEFGANPLSLDFAGGRRPAYLH